MFKYFIKRLLLLIPVVLGVSVLVFIIMHVFTTDPSATILGQHASQDQIDALRQQLGLNDPLYIQYLDFITGILQGDFGTSLITKSSVATEIFSRFPATIELAIISIIVASIVGITLGVLSAVKQNSIIDYLCMGTSLLGVSMPIFWLGLILIVVFSVTLGMASCIR